VPANLSALPGQLRMAIALIGLESLALRSLAVVLLFKTITGHPHSLPAALLGVAMTVFGAAVLFLCARGLAALSPSARSPVVVIELIALPVSYTLTFQAGLVGYGAPILVIALAVLYLVFTPAVRKILDREL
jgi:hypothetical protein